jgi:hypothetical protein
MDKGSSLIPCVLYRDAPAAIAWLGEVFGLREQLRAPGEDGSIHHAQLLHGHGMLMLGTLRDGGYAGNLREIPRASTWCWRMSTAPMPAYSAPAARSLFRSRTRNTAAAASPAATSRVSCGAWAATIPGAGSPQALKPAAWG